MFKLRRHSLISQSRNRSTQSKSHLTIEEKKNKALRLAKLKHHSRCNNCGEKGHFANECPNDSASSVEGSSQSQSQRSSKSKIHSHKRKSHANLTASKLVKDSDSDTKSLTSSSSEAYCISSTRSSNNFLWISDSSATEHMIEKKE